MLKGGGAITDYESRKAEAAMARLSRVQDEASFKSALKDLKDAIIEGQAKLDAAAKGQPTSQPATTDSAAPATSADAAPASMAQPSEKFLNDPNVAKALKEGLSAQDIWDNLSEAGKAAYNK